MKKVRKLAVVAVLVVVLVGLLVVPAFAYENTQIGTSPYQTVTSLSSYFGRGYEGNQTSAMYTYCIDIDALCQFMVSTYSVDEDDNIDLGQFELPFDMDFRVGREFYNFSLEVNEVPQTDTTSVVCVIWYNYVAEAIYEFTWTDILNYGSDGNYDYFLIPFDTLDFDLSMNSAPWRGPEPVYQIFNNNQLTNSGNVSNGYDIGRQVGIQEGYENGYTAGVADGSTEEETSAVIRLVKAVIEAPFYSISHAFDFTVFGINFANLIMGILSLLIAFFVIRFVVRFFV